MNINDAFPSKYLKAGDLPEDGSEIFTIEKVDLAEVGDEKQSKLVISFEESEKGLVCNKTNAKLISRVVGSEDCDDWIGQKIALYRTEVQFKDDMVEAIRVKRPKPPEKPAKPAKTKTHAPASDDPDEDEIPF